jgi:hypothetical protein
MQRARDDLSREAAMSKMPNLAGELCQLAMALVVCVAYQTAIATLNVSNRVRSLSGKPAR